MARSVSGAGKSVMAVALSRLGFPLAADDLVIAKATGQGVRAAGFRQPLKLKDSDVSEDLARLIIRSSARRPDGKNLIAPPEPDAEWANRFLPVAAIIFLEKARGGPSALKPLPVTEAVFKTMEAFPPGAGEREREKALELWTSLEGAGFYQARGGDTPLALAKKIAEKL